MKLLDTVLLFSLPASGKSEVRTYMASLTEEQCRRDFGMGPTLQLDDYPYVHLMHCIDDELRKHGWHDVYYYGPNRPFRDNWTWAVLIELLNEDYAHLLAQQPYQATSAAELLLDRLDAAHLKLGLPDVLGEVPHRIRKKVAACLESEAARELTLLNRTVSQDRTGKTIVIEAARGGPNGAAFPLCPPHGYATAFETLSPTILERSSVLYIWVDPAESRRKNIARGQPNAQGSILHHCVPMEVMLGQYGTDDMAYLMSQSDQPGTIRIDRIVEQAGRYETRTYRLPVARLDNRVDKTTFVRAARDEWRAEDIEALHSGLAGAFAQLGKALS